MAQFVRNHRLPGWILPTDSSITCWCKIKTLSGTSDSSARRKKEQAANRKAVELLNNSPYKNQLGNSGLFLTALESRQREIPNLISGHLGNRVPVVGDLKSTTPVDAKQNPQQIAALPLGGRVKMDPWNDKLELIKSKRWAAIAEREKMPFEVTPFMPYLTRFWRGFGQADRASVAPTEPKPGDPGNKRSPTRALD